MFITLLKIRELALYRGRWMEPVPGPSGSPPASPVPGPGRRGAAPSVRSWPVPRVRARRGSGGPARRAWEGRRRPAPASMTSAPEPGIPAAAGKGGRRRRLPEQVSGGLSGARGAVMSESSISALPPGRPSRQPFLHQGRAAGTGLQAAGGHAGTRTRGAGSSARAEPPSHLPAWGKADLSYSCSRSSSPSSLHLETSLPKEALEWESRSL